MNLLDEIKIELDFDSTLLLLKEHLDYELGFSDAGEGENFTLYHKGERVTELFDEKEQNLKVSDILEAEEDDESLYVLGCHLKNAGINVFHGPKKIFLRNATNEQLVIQVEYRKCDMNKVKSEK